MKQNEGPLRRARGFRFGRLMALALALGPSGSAAAEPAADGPRIGTTKATSEQPTQGWLVLYQPGPEWREGLPLHQQPLADHRQYMISLYRHGVLKFAGPFADGSGGAVMLLAADGKSAQALVDADPAVTDGIFTYELRPWILLPWEHLAAGASGHQP